MPEMISVDVEDGVATILLQRPPMNALCLQMQREIKQAAEELGARSDVGAVVLYGGPKVFAAGADIKEMADMTYQDMLRASSGLQDAFTAVARIPQPTIAAVTGYALGGGCELALCCDLRFAADDAKLGQPEILLGIIPGAGGTQRLPRLIGVSRAKDLILTGRHVGRGRGTRPRARQPRGAGRPRSTPTRESWRAGWPRGRRSRCGRPRRRSTGAWMPISRPDSTSSACASPPCSRPTTSRSGCPRSSRSGRRSSPATDLTATGRVAGPVDGRRAYARLVRILHLSWEYPPVMYGGLGRHVHALAETQAAMGDDVVVISQAAEGARG